MDIRVLRYCETIARLGNITRAAAELHIAQPALSVA
ncbi:MAG TPA: LysR family transcriptional regulator, partial [Paraburkholderia sp.]